MDRSSILISSRRIDTHVRRIENSVELSTGDILELMAERTNGWMMRSLSLVFVPPNKDNQIVEKKGWIFVEDNLAITKALFPGSIMSR